MTKDQKIIKGKVGLLELARQLGNVSQACKMLGYSRDSFYRFKELYDKGGELALQEMSRKKPILANRTAPEIEARTVEFSLSRRPCLLFGGADAAFCLAKRQHGQDSRRAGRLLRTPRHARARKSPPRARLFAIRTRAGATRRDRALPRSTGRRKTAATSVASGPFPGLI